MVEKWGRGHGRQSEQHYVFSMIYFFTSTAEGEDMASAVLILLGKRLISPTA